MSRLNDVNDNGGQIDANTTISTGLLLTNTATAFTPHPL